MGIRPTPKVPDARQGNILVSDFGRPSFGRLRETAVALFVWLLPDDLVAGGPDPQSVEFDERIGVLH